MNTAESIQHRANLTRLVAGLIDLEAVPLNSLDPVTVSGVELDSRQLRKGDLFLACFGRNHDARDYIPQAIANGAAAVLAEAGGDWQGLRLIDEVPVLAVNKLSARMSLIAGRFYGDPSAELSVIGITGTNGKTSCSQFIAQLLAEYKRACGLIGTLGFGTLERLEESQLTTPDAVFVQKTLAHMANRQLDPVVMEVSSVGLDQSRVAAVQFDTAVFTNISRDHLDYHKTMTDYAHSKRKLFAMSGLNCAVVNLDDPYAPTMLNALSSDARVITFSERDTNAAVHAENIVWERDGFRATINTPWGRGQIEASLLGSFNFSNVLAVIATLIGYLERQGETDLKTLCQRVSCLRPVAGRMEIIGEVDGVTAVVDYAHTPEGLRSALDALRQHFDGDIVCVFGCGGNRDRGKRPLMGEIAEQHADRLILSDDNPRREEGDRIIEHILSGIDDHGSVSVLRDRADAIASAIAEARSGDVVLVAGKGHETYQEIDGVRHLFSDASQVRLALQQRAERGAE